jgi:hypothetical protein
LRTGTLRQVLDFGLTARAAGARAFDFLFVDADVKIRAIDEERF